MWRRLFTLLIYLCIIINVTKGSSRDKTPFCFLCCFKTKVSPSSRSICDIMKYNPIKSLIYDYLGYFYIYRFSKTNNELYKHYDRNVASGIHYFLPYVEKTDLSYVQWMEVQVSRKKEGDIVTATEKDTKHPDAFMGVILEMDKILSWVRKQEKVIPEVEKMTKMWFAHPDNKRSDLQLALPPVYTIAKFLKDWPVPNTRIPAKPSTGTISMAYYPYRNILRFLVPLQNIGMQTMDVGMSNVPLNIAIMMQPQNAKSDPDTKPPTIYFNFLRMGRPMVGNYYLLRNRLVFRTVDQETTELTFDLFDYTCRYFIELQCEIDAQGQMKRYSCRLMNPYNKDDAADWPEISEEKYRKEFF